MCCLDCQFDPPFLGGGDSPRGVFDGMASRAMRRQGGPVINADLPTPLPIATRRDRQLPHWERLIRSPRRRWRVTLAAGMVTPSAFAVLRLMVRSNFVGCSTGRSAGFAPLRIR